MKQTKAMLNGWIGLICVLLGAGTAQASVEPSSAPPSVYTETVLDAGEDWKLVNTRGTLDNGQPYDQNLYMLQNHTGIDDSPLPYELKEDLALELDGGDTVLILNKLIVDEISSSLSQGSLTPMLQAIAEAERRQPAPMELGQTVDPQRLCSNRIVKVVTREIQLNRLLKKTEDLGQGFSATLALDGNVQGKATGDVFLSIRRVNIFGGCIPYAVRFSHVRVYGDALVNYGVTLSGSLNMSKSWEFQIAKPFLFSINANVGYVPVHIGFNLPLTFGLDLKAGVTGAISYNGQQSAQGHFDYTCTLNGCYGNSGYTLADSNPPQSITGSVSGRLEPSVWAQVGLRAYLYTEHLAYAQVSVRPSLYGDLWGYSGNTCGDADGDGHLELVQALTFDLDWQVALTAHVSAFDKPSKKWNLWSTSRKHLRLWNLGGPAAMQPILSGPDNVMANASTRYGLKMRPCWPYDSEVSYQLSWGDGSTLSLSGEPQTLLPTYQTWSLPGTYTAALTALQDAHGRQLQATTARTIEVAPSPVPAATWTGWLYRDEPGGSGDWETLSDFVAMGMSCSNPIAIECRTRHSHVNWTLTGENYSCSLSTSGVQGGVCENDKQPDGQCLDYEVRFLCP
ncbi:MAG TPA: hypothetical protein VF815_24405 [Myxococcaceae bacterium]|jgi:hypothetical protein